MATKEICIASKAKLKLVAAGFVTLIQFYDAFGSAAIDDAVHQKDHIKHLSIRKDVTGCMLIVTTSWYRSIVRV